MFATSGAAQAANPCRAPCPLPLGGGLGGQPQVAQDPLDHRSLHECGDDLELAAAEVRAVLQGDVEDPLEQPRPADAYGLNLGGLGHALDAASGNAWRFLILGRPLWHHPRAQLRVRGQHAMESYEVLPGPRSPDPACSLHVARPLCRCGPGATTAHATAPLLWCAGAELATALRVNSWQRRFQLVDLWLAPVTARWRLRMPSRVA